MTEAEQPTPWLDWSALETAFQNPKKYDYQFKPQFAAVGGEALRRLVRDALESTKSDDAPLKFTVPEKPDGLVVRLGQHNTDEVVFWRAFALLSPVSGSGDPKGLPGKEYTVRQGLNFWLEIPGGQRYNLFQSALRDATRRQVFLQALLDLPSSYRPFLTSPRGAYEGTGLEHRFPDVWATRTPHRNPFKDTDILPEHEQVLAALLERYAAPKNTQRFLFVTLSIPVSPDGPPPLEQTREVLKALDALAMVIDGLSEAALPEAREATEQLEQPRAAPSNVDIVAPAVSALELSEPARRLLDLTRFTRNVILYGPPGTGKTFAIQQFQQHFLAAESAQSAKLSPSIDLASLKRWQAIALTLYQQGEPLTVTVTKLLQEQPLAAFEAQRNIRNAYGSVMTELIEHAVNESGEPLDPKYSREPFLFRRLPSKQWTLTDAGRGYVEANLLSRPAADWSADPAARMAFVTFHPSYAYEEFVEGLRPSTEGGQLSYDVRDGVFKRICQSAERELRDARAAGRTPRPFLLVIDEINRANIAKVFGELMTLIEDDKRVTVDGKGIRVQLPYSDGTELFGVPENLTIVGAMNTADRSIALLDLALRRRFTFLEVLPDVQVIRDTTGDGGVVEGINVAQLLEHLNSRVRVLLDRDHQIGHSYLTGIKRGLPELHFRWYHKVIPLLQEYFYNDGEKLQQVLGKAFVELGDRPAGVGSRRSYTIRSTQGNEFVQALQQLAQKSSAASPDSPSGERDEDE